MNSRSLWTSYQQQQQKSSMDQYRLLHFGSPLSRKYQLVSAILQYYTLFIVIDRVPHYDQQRVKATKNTDVFSGLTKVQ